MDTKKLQEKLYSMFGRELSKDNFADKQRVMRIIQMVNQALEVDAEETKKLIFGAESLHKIEEGLGQILNSQIQQTNAQKNRAQQAQSQSQPQSPSKSQPTPGDSWWGNLITSIAVVFQLGRLFGQLPKRAKVGVEIILFILAIVGVVLFMGKSPEKGVKYVPITSTPVTQVVTTESGEATPEIEVTSTPTEAEPTTSMEPEIKIDVDKALSEIDEVAPDYKVPISLKDWQKNKGYMPFNIILLLIALVVFFASSESVGRRESRDAVLIFIAVSIAFVAFILAPKFVATLWQSLLSFFEGDVLFLVVALVVGSLGLSATLSGKTDLTPLASVLFAVGLVKYAMLPSFAPAIMVVMLGVALELYELAFRQKKQVIPSLVFPFTFLAFKKIVLFVILAAKTATGLPDGILGDVIGWVFDNAYLIGVFISLLLAIGVTYILVAMVVNFSVRRIASGDDVQSVLIRNEGWRFDTILLALMVLVLVQVWRGGYLW